MVQIPSVGITYALLPVASATDGVLLQDWRRRPSNIPIDKPLQDWVEHLLLQQDIGFHLHPDLARGNAITDPVLPNGLGRPITDVPVRPCDGDLIFGLQHFEAARIPIIDPADEKLRDSCRKGPTPEAGLT